MNALQAVVRVLRRHRHDAVAVAQVSPGYAPHAFRRVLGAETINRTTL